jgi:hypothetical protein
VLGLGLGLGIRDMIHDENLIEPQKTTGGRRHIQDVFFVPFGASCRLREAFKNLSVALTPTQLIVHTCREHSLVHIDHIHTCDIKL